VINSLSSNYSGTRPAPVNMTDTTPEHIWYAKSSEWEYEQEWLRSSTVIR